MNSLVPWTGYFCRLLCFIILYLRSFLVLSQVSPTYELGRNRVFSMSRQSACLDLFCEIHYWNGSSNHATFKIHSKVDVLLNLYSACNSYIPMILHHVLWLAVSFLGLIHLMDLIGWWNFSLSPFIFKSFFLVLIFS